MLQKLYNDVLNYIDDCNKDIKETHIITTTNSLVTLLNSKCNNNIDKVEVLRLAKNIIQEQLKEEQEQLALKHRETQIAYDNIKLLNI